jgi:hypothetical protein
MTLSFPANASSVGDHFVGKSWVIDGGRVAGSNFYVGFCAGTFGNVRRNFFDTTVNQCLLLITERPDGTDHFELIQE